MSQGDHLAGDTGPVGICGLGLLGGSIGLDLVAAGREVLGWSPSPGSREAALERRAVTELAITPEEIPRRCGVVIVAAPPAATALVAAGLLDAAPGVVVTDVASVKTGIMAEVAHRSPQGSLRFVGGHPMAGTEHRGVDNAQTGMFGGATWVLTPAYASWPAVRVVHDLAAALGAALLYLTPEAHDRGVAWSSHLPRLLAHTAGAGAAHVVPGGPPVAALAAGGFRDLTRTADHAPSMWAEILLGNAANVLDAIDRAQADLGGVRDAIVAEDEAALTSLLGTSVAIRGEATARIAERAGPWEQVRLPEPLPGLLALGVAGIVAGAFGDGTVAVPAARADDARAILSGHP